MKNSIYAAVAGLTLLATSAYATPFTPQEHSRLQHGVYLGTEVNVIKRGNTEADDIPMRIGDGIFPFSARPFLGYRFNDSFSLEAGYDSVSHISDKEVTSGTAFPYSSKIYGADLSAVFNQAFENGLNIYLRTGLAAMKTNLYNKHFIGPPTDINETNIVPVIGTGIDYYFTKRYALGLTASYMPRVNHTPHVAFIGLRTSYTF